MEAAGMRRLTLLRHGHAAPGNAAIPDHERPLTQQGSRDATLMGQRLRMSGVRPSLILMSPALRTLQTARLLARALGYPQEFLQREPGLYLAAPAEILTVLAGQDDAFMDILICGHNPGLTDLYQQLTETPQDGLPTCGMATIGLAARSWSSVTAGILLDFDQPHGGGVAP